MELLSISIADKTFSNRIQMTLRPIMSKLALISIGNVSDFETGNETAAKSQAEVTFLSSYARLMRV